MPEGKLTMLSKDAIAGVWGECYATIDGARYNIMTAIKFEAKYTKNKAKLPILGRVNKGNKAISAEGTETMTMYYNSSVMRELLEKYQNTGEDIYFDIEVANEDPNSAAGRQSVLIQGCNLDGGVIGQFDANGEYLEEEVSFTFEKWILNKKFNVLDGMM